MNVSNPLNAKGLLLLSGLMGFLVLANYQQLMSLLYETGTFLLITSGAREATLANYLIISHLIGWAFFIGLTIFLMRRLMTAETVSKTWLITLLIAWPVIGYLNLQFGIINQVLIVHEMVGRSTMDFLQLRANVSFIGESVYRLTVIGSVIYLLARKAA